ncbi:MAG: hypothetical protein AAFQ82_17345, partial [Myxococcota bacterium]
MDSDPSRPPASGESKRLKIAIGGFAAVLLATMIVSMHLSTLDVSFGTLVYGSPRIWRGHEGHLRVVAVDPRANHRPVPILQGEMRIRDTLGERVRIPLVPADSDPAPPQVHVRFAVPEDLAPESVAEFVVITEFGEDRFTQTLRAVDHPRGARAKVVSHRESLAKRGRPKPGSATELRLYPRSGVLVDGVENQVLGWIPNVPGATVLHSDSPSFRAETDSSGTFEFRWLPRPSPTGYRFNVGESPSVLRTLNVINEQRQLVAELGSSSFVTPGSNLELVVRSLPMREPILVDLWIGSTLVHTQRRSIRGRLETSIPIPPDYEGLARVDVYRALFAPEQNSSSLSLWVSDSRSSDAVHEAVQALSGFPGDDPVLSAARAADGDAAMRFGEMALSRLVPDTVGASLVRTTVQERT